METQSEFPGVVHPRSSTYDPIQEQQLENRFVTGYMALMCCSENAARAVYMYMAAPGGMGAFISE